MPARQSRGGGTEPLRQRTAKIDDCPIQNPAYRFARHFKLPHGSFFVICHCEGEHLCSARGNPTKIESESLFYQKEIDDMGIPTLEMIGE